MQKFNEIIVNRCNTWAMPFSRFAIFFIYFYFGAIKVLAENGAANPLVVGLLNKTLSFIPPDLFLILFGLFEMLIGLTFLFPKFNRIGLVLLTLHLITTIVPLVLMPEYTWKSFLVPTLEGQYIIKNILIIAIAMGILSNLDEYEEIKHNYV
jgi:uncharacterized membrane protein YkgB